MARQRGPIGGGVGAGGLLDVLTVRLDWDLTGFRRGLAEIITGLRTLRGEINARAGGASLGDAVNAALVVPLIAATARMGQIRNEVRLLTSEMRNMAQLTFGPGARGSNAGWLTPYVAPGAPATIDASRMRHPNGWPVSTRGPDGRMRAQYGVESDDLRDAAGGGGGMVPPIITGGGSAQDDDGPRRRRGGGGGLFGGLFGRERQRTGDAFDRGRSNFPGYDDAVDNLGGNAHKVGGSIRRGAGGRLASALGLVGVGAIFGDLIALAGSLATIIGGTLSGAFAALLTPLGLVVALVGSLVALFVASNWDTFKEFAEWFGTRARQLMGEALGDIVSGWGNFGQAVTELWNLMRAAFSDDSGSLLGILQGFGEFFLRVINACAEVLGGLGNVCAELVRALTSLFQGDFQGVLDHLLQAVQHAFEAIGEAILSLLPELREPWENFWTWMTDKARDVGNAVSGFFNPPARGDGITGARGDGTVRGGVGDDDLSDTGKRSTFGKVMADMTRGAIEQVGDAASEAIAEETQAVSEDERLGVLGRSFVQRGTEEIVGAANGAGFSLRRVLFSIVSDLQQRAAQGLASIVQEMLTGVWNGTQKGGGLGSWLGGLFGGGGVMGQGKGPANSGGGVLSFLGSMFSGFFADGGFIPPGSWGITGERGPEVVFGGRAGASVFANDNGGGTYVDRRQYNFHGSMAEMAEFQRQIRAVDGSIETRALGAYGEARRRGRI